MRCLLFYVCLYDYSSVNNVKLLHPVWSSGMIWYSTTAFPPQQALTVHQAFLKNGQDPGSVNIKLIFRQALIVRYCADSVAPDSSFSLGSALSIFGICIYSYTGLDLYIQRNFGARSSYIQSHGPDSTNQGLLNGTSIYVQFFCFGADICWQIISVQVAMINMAAHVWNEQVDRYCKVLFEVLFYFTWKQSWLIWS